MKKIRILQLIKAAANLPQLAVLEVNAKYGVDEGLAEAHLVRLRDEIPPPKVSADKDFVINQKPVPKKPFWLGKL